MHVRKKRNRSGSTSVVVVSKHSGRYKEVHVVGVSLNPSTIDELHRQGLLWIKQQTGLSDMPDIFKQYAQEKFEEESVDFFFNHIESILLNGTQLILQRVFGLIGFDRIDDPEFRQLVISRICQPLSKAATVDYLKSHFNEDVKLYKLYEYLDKLYDTQKDRVEQISVEHTRKILGGSIGLVFYDVTTLYFETDQGDELRKPGYSKDGKHALPQVVLGLLVSEGGYPLAYSIHEGNKYEGHTMLPIVEEFVKKFDLKNFVVVADSGLMNKDNIKLLEEGKYQYILGARIKNESAEVKQWILSLEKKDGCFDELGKLPKTRLIVGYSEKRAKKDAYNRNKGLKRLEKTYQTGSVTKEKINKRGYNKFLEISDDITVQINYAKVKEDERWDGWKGYLTNTDLPAEKTYQQYRSLWQVEHAFRITKGRLDLRPMFHFTEKRIKAHVCICFVAYKVYKELERILKTNKIDMSVDKVLEIAKTITTIRVRLPHSNKVVERTTLITEAQKSIACLFDEEFWRLRSEAK
ncbi:MAG: IS1634 family transposase [Tannerella sp.]|nr:IS1634 family transposase [Tannerella sp.]